MKKNHMKTCIFERFGGEIPSFKLVSNPDFIFKQDFIGSLGHLHRLVEDLIRFLNIKFKSNPSIFERSGAKRNQLGVQVSETPPGV